MIPARTPYNAIYRKADADPKDTTTLRVEAWSDDGEALVVDMKDGRLRPARGYTDFVGLGEADDERTVAVIPGGGWRVHKTYTKESVTLPVIGWVVDESGWARPLLEEDGTPVGPDDGHNARLIPPGEPDPSPDDAGPV